jgi:hypothetical protein
LRRKRKSSSDIDGRIVVLVERNENLLLSGEFPPEMSSNSFFKNENIEDGVILL